AVQEILVDRGQLVVEHLVQEFDDLGITFHGLSPSRQSPQTIQSPCSGRRNENGNGLPSGKARVTTGGEGELQAATSGSGHMTTTCARAWANVARASSSQQPQQSEQPVRACTSAKLCTPSAASRRMSWSVTALHRQIYMARIRTRMRMIVNN